MHPIGPDVKGDIVVFFKVDSTREQIYRFSNETISDPKDGGSWPLPGIRMISHVLPMDGHEGYAINFFPEATEQQRQYVRSRIDSSPIVYKVIENVAPAHVKAADLKNVNATSNKRLQPTPR